MTMRVRAVSALLAVFVAGACRDPLVAENLANPDVERVFRQPASIEQAIGTSYQVCRNAALANNMFQQLLTMSGESYSQLNNFSMGPRGALPRSPILNNKSAQQAEQGRFSAYSRNGRFVANAVQALDRLIENGGTLGSDAQNKRARAFGFFGIACNLGYLAMAYDSGGIVDHKMPSDSVPPLSGAKEIGDAALAFLDSAIAMAQAPATGSNGFPTPAPWMSGHSFTANEFVAWARSWKARIRTAVARSKAERDGLNWQAVLDDATNGIAADIPVEIGGTTGWNIGFQGFQMHVDAAWSQLSMMYYGFADVSGGYATDIAKPTDARGYFLLVTPDLRWPQGTTRAAQQAASPEPSTWTNFPYIKNRPGADTPGDPWGASFYEHHRYKYIQINSSTGTYPEFLKAEVDLLAAEANIRLGNIAAAASLIDKTRTAAGLPALAGAVTTATQPVPGGANCVPKIPDPNTAALSCGTILEAMKYEKRMELAFNRLGAWFFDSRGWEDLIVDTPIHYPVPVDELDARLKPYYNMGGGGPGSAPRGTYGF